MSNTSAMNLSRDTLTS